MCSSDLGVGVCVCVCERERDMEVGVKGTEPVVEPIGGHRSPSARCLHDDVHVIDTLDRRAQWKSRRAIELCHSSVSGHACVFPQELHSTKQSPLKVLPGTARPVPPCTKQGRSGVMDDFGTVKSGFSPHEFDLE